MSLTPIHLGTLRRTGPGVMLAAWCNLGLFAISVAMLPFDNRQILGLNPWIKPIKFQISTIVYAVTIAVFLALLARQPGSGTAQSRRWRSIVDWAIGAAMLVENLLISMQSFRGVRSHMNFSSWFDAITFAIMGVFILVNTAAVGILLAVFWRRLPALASPVTWGIRLGLISLLAGSMEGVMIVAHGAHTVGGRDGGAGLPFVNWSLAHGDLRIAHFFALHALQLLPLVGYALSRTRLQPRLQLASLYGATALYFAGVWLLFQQALAGKPLLG